MILSEVKCEKNVAFSENKSSSMKSRSNSGKDKSETQADNSKDGTEKSKDDAETKSNESKPNTPTEISSLLPGAREGSQGDRGEPDQRRAGVHRQNRRPIRSVR